MQFSISDDEGKTWGEPKSLPKNADAESIIRHPIVELGPKEWLFPLSDQTVIYDPGTEKVTPFGDGHKHGLVPIVRTPKGTLVSGAGLRSEDAGKTWQKVAHLPGRRRRRLALRNVRAGQRLARCRRGRRPWRRRQSVAFRRLAG